MKSIWHEWWADENEKTRLAVYTVYLILFGYLLTFWIGLKVGGVL